MKITDVHVDGFGVWSHLDLTDLSDRITVFYGPNEAGKTTLLEFVRSVLYGMTPERRERYLPPLGGGRSGGSLRVAFQNDRYEIGRRAEAGDPEDGLLAVTALDGTSVDRGLLEKALQGIDEATYRHLFAVGLQELQQLGTLDDGDAARWLYELTTGLDRVSLSEVMHELTRSRERLLAADDQPSVLAELTARHQQLTDELNQLPTIAGTWTELACQRGAIEQQIEQLEADCRQCHDKLLWLDRALAIHEPWQRRVAIDEALGHVAESPRLPAGGIEQLNTLRRRRKRYRAEGKKVQQQIAESKAELGRLGRKRAVWRQAARIEALGEQLDWIVSLESEIREHDEHLTGLKSQWDSHRRQLAGDDENAATDLTAAAARALPKLQVRAGEVRAARQQLTTAEAKLAACQQELASHATGRHGGSDADLPAAVEQAGERVAQLRRRLAIDERLDEMQIHAQDLDEQTASLLDHQLMPLRALAGLGAVFVLGVMLILIGLFFPQSMVGTFGRTLGLIGVFGAGTAAAVKFLLERSNTKQLEYSQKQLDLLGQQIHQAQEERDTLDEQLPHGGGPLAKRLQTAERELAKLEEQLPRTAQRQQANRAVELAQRELDATRQQLGAARKAWKQALVHAGLPQDLTPRRLRDLAQHRESLDDLRNRWERGRHDLTQRRTQYEVMARRIHQLAADVGLASDGMAAGDVLQQLQQMWNRQKPRMARRRKLRRRVQQLQRRFAQATRGWRKLTRELDQLLSQAGVAHIDEYRQMALETSRVEHLRQERREISREIAAALEECGRAADVEQLLTANQVDALSVRHQQAKDALAGYQQQLKEHTTELGAVRHQLDELAGDRRREEKILELSAIETELSEAAARWQTHTVTWLMLDSVRDEYQRTRQPETLVEASEYLRRLTDGRYLRVWTPLDEALLYVDDADGQTLSVEVLSRGTREQLFLSLRLALIACYARRQVQLPVVLDDVLVNFDIGRAEAAARLLCDFARDGHQLLVFTCHQHVWEMFQSMQVDTRQLPSRTDRQPVNTPAIQAGKPFLLDQHENDLQLVVEEPDAHIEPDPLDFWIGDTDRQVDGEYVTDDEPVVEEEGPVEVERELPLEVADEPKRDQPAPMPPPAEPIIDVNALLAADAAVDPVGEEPFEIFPPIVESEEGPIPPHDPNGRPRPETDVIVSGDWVRIGETVRRREMLPGERQRNRQQRSQWDHGDDLGAHAA